MAKGVKTQQIPQVGDLATMLYDGQLYQDMNGDEVAQEVPKGASLGAIQEITFNGYYTEVYKVEKGWVPADEVSTKANPNYEYSSGSGGKFWDVFGKVLDIGVGIFGKTTQKTTTDPDTDTTTTTTDRNQPEAEQKSVPTWVWVTGGVLVFGGLMLAIFLPKKEPKPSPDQPLIVRQ
ncbi:hypothetical protein P1X15_10775 [Runella sp. MFBS21]|uniref:hypothetical protein n=1 Tax=Runella sp. MFBS21 TaxID=3034018 RepID=UPI0023F9A843|nr:hypothetical protein [Runella sp. MFBS21]MDF7818083.1 hypothetical protein [Runella sp. MFBS21]